MTSRIVAVLVFGCWAASTGAVSKQDECSKNASLYGYIDKAERVCQYQVPAPIKHSVKEIHKDCAVLYGRDKDLLLERALVIGINEFDKFQAENGSAAACLDVMRSLIGE